jgi:hypothetical protein
LRAHCRQIIAGPFEKAAVDLPCRAGQPGGHTHNQHTALRQAQFLNRDTVAQSLVQSGLGAARVFERLRTYDEARSFVGHTQHDGAAAFVGQGYAVLEQFFKVITLLGFLELKPLTFRLKQPLVKLGGRGEHDHSLN